MDRSACQEGLGKFAFYLKTDERRKVRKQKCERLPGGQPVMQDRCFSAQGPTCYASTDQPMGARADGRMLLVKVTEEKKKTDLH